MANKQVNQLEALEGVSSNDLVAVYDVDSVDFEKLMKVTQYDITIPKWNPNDALVELPSPVCISELNVTLTPLGAGGRVVVSAADFIMSVNDNTSFGGGPPYTYGFNLVGDAPDPTHSNPRDAALAFSCSHVGAKAVQVWVIDKRGWTGAPPLYGSYVVVVVNIADNIGICV